MPASMEHIAALASKAPSKVKSFVTGVLARWAPDGCYYLVTILASDRQARNCQVLFEDGYKSWIDAKDVHCELDIEKLEESDIVCCVCDDGQHKEANEIVVCDLCQQGYHLRCHNPPLDGLKVGLDDEKVEWICTTCQDISRRKDNNTQMAADKQQSNVEQPITAGVQTTSSRKIKKPAKEVATPARKPRTTSKSAQKPRKSISKPLVESSKKRLTSTPKIKLNKNEQLPKDLVIAEQVAPARLDDHAPQSLDTKVGQPSLPKLDEKRSKSGVKGESTTIVMETDENKAIAPDNRKPGAVDGSDVGTVEKMDPLLISAAKVLAHDASSVGTESFVKLISADGEAHIARKPKGITRKNQRKVTAAA